MKAYNGHRSWNAWNVSLWIANDEPLYRLALDCLEHSATLAKAVRLFILEVGVQYTPDGARYTVRSVHDALKGLRD